MASATLIRVSEYLKTTWRPDRDYIDGEVKERNWGDRPHAAMQAILATIFNSNRRVWNIVALTEQRVQTSAKHFRIPDVCVLRLTDPVDPIVHVAPLVCVEILCPRDSLSDMQERVDDYFQMGVAHVWVIDPRNRRAYVASTKGFQEPANAEFSVPETPIRISVADVFTEFDEMQSQTSL